MRIKQIFIIVTCLCIILAFTSCKPQETSNPPIISENAVIYEFDSDNILEYKGIVIDNDFIIYKFGKNSELVKAVNNYDNMKTWMKTKDKEDRRISIDEWELIENEQEIQLVIHCNPQDYDLEAGPFFSNCRKRDGYELEFSNDMIDFSVRKIEIPSLMISDIRNYERFQIYLDGKWSEIEETYLGDVPQ